MGLATKVHSSFWSDEDVGKLSAQEKLAALWVITNKDMNNIGFLKASRRQFEFDTGLPVKALEGACKGLARGFVFEESTGSIGILSVNYVHYQFGDVAFNHKNLIVKNLVRLFDQLSEVMRQAIVDRYEGLASIVRSGSYAGISGFQSPLQAPYKGNTSPLQAPYKPLEGDRKDTEQSRAEQSLGSVPEGVQGEGHFPEVTSLANGMGKLRWDLAQQCLQFLNTKSGAAFLETQATLHEIALRLYEVNQDVEGVKAMVERQVGLWAGDARMRNYLRPATLFGPKFAEYYGQRSLALAPAGGPERMKELEGLIERSRANPQSVYHSVQATPQELAQLREWRRELQAHKKTAA